MLNGQDSIPLSRITSLLASSLSDEKSQIQGWPPSRPFVCTKVASDTLCTGIVERTPRFRIVALRDLGHPVEGDLV
jgi:hypothetical protein